MDMTMSSIRPNRVEVVTSGGLSPRFLAKNVGVSSLTEAWQGLNLASGPATDLTGPRSTILVSSGLKGTHSSLARAKFAKDTKTEAKKS
jgi:hypothetical protein